MAFNEFKRQIWEDVILDKLDNVTVFKGLCNTKYTGMIKEAGSSIKFKDIGNVTTKKYEDDNVTYDKLKSASKTLVVDQEYYTAVTVDDIDEVQADGDLLGLAGQRMGESMAQNVDLHVAGLYSDAGITIGSTASPTSITSSNVIEFFTDVATAMDENNAPQANRVAVVPPWLYQKLVLAGILTDTNNSLILNNGQVGERLGFTVYKSNNVSHDSTTWYAPMFFVKGMTIGYAGQITKMQKGQHENSFAEYVRALNTYGSKVLYPQTLCAAYLSQGSES